MKFHDGSEFTANDVIATYQKLVNQEDANIPAYLAHVESIEKIDDHKIVIKTNEPDPLLNQKINSLLISKENYVGT